MWVTDLKLYGRVIKFCTTECGYLVDVRRMPLRRNRVLLKPDKIVWHIGYWRESWNNIGVGKIMTRGWRYQKWKSGERVEARKKHHKLMIHPMNCNDLIRKYYQLHYNASRRYASWSECDQKTWLLFDKVISTREGMYQVFEGQSEWMKLGSYC